MPVDALASENAALPGRPWVSVTPVSTPVPAFCTVSVNVTFCPAMTGEFEP